MSAVKTFVVSALALASASVARAQWPPVRLEKVVGAPAIAVGAAWWLGSAGDAAILGRCRLAHALAKAPGVRASLAVENGVAVIVGVVGVRERPLATTFLEALFAAHQADDDTIALAVAAAALAADDDGVFVPGGVLAARAAAAFGAKSPPRGDPAAMLQWGPERVRDRLLGPARTQVAARGDLDATFAGLAARLPFERSPGRMTMGGEEAVRPAVPRDDPPPEPRQEVHPRIDQPFVMAAFRAPAAAQLAPFAVAIEAARTRAARQLRLRGSEAKADTPPVAWSWLDGDEIVRFHRRGETPLQLLPKQVAPADAAAEAKATAAELAAFLDGLRREPLSEAEVVNARARLRATLGLEPPTAATCAPEVIGGQLRASMLARGRGIDATTIDAVTAGDAAAALAAALDPARAYWHTLLPAARKERGWRRR